MRENGATSGVGVLATYTYDDLGRRTGVTLGNGASQAYTYDAVSRLASLTNDLSGTTSDLSVTFAYNPASQITQTVRTGDAYAWGGHGNGSTSYTSNGLNQLTAVGSGTPTHDANGNLTYEPQSGKTYSYNSENKLKTASGGVSLYYDPVGRIAEYDTSTSSRFMSDGAEVTVEIDNPGSNVVRRFVRGDGPDELIAWYEGSGTTSRRFTGLDERGSIVSATDGSGTLIGLNAYDEYGKPGASNIGRFQYTGQMWLSDANLYYYKGRMYLPSWGRFPQPDPIGYLDSPNPYQYVLNDPVNLSDPLGLQGCPPECTPIPVTGTRLPGQVSSSPSTPAPMGLATPERDIEVIARRIRQRAASAIPHSPSPVAGFDACLWAPLNARDRGLFDDLRSDPTISGAMNSAWQQSVASAREPSFLIYGGPLPSIRQYGRFARGPIREGYENATSPLQDLDLRYPLGILLANFHTHPGSKPSNRFPSTADSNYNKRTRSLGILRTSWGLSAGRQCAP